MMSTQARPELEDFAAWLRERMTEHSLTQTELAEMLGVEQSTISYWANGLRQPIQRHSRELAKIFKRSEEEVLRLAGHRLRVVPRIPVEDEGPQAAFGDRYPTPEQYQAMRQARKQASGKQRARGAGVKLTFGEWLADRLDEHDLLQSELGSALSPPVSQPTISRWIKHSDSHRPNPEQCHQLARLFDEPLEEVLRLAGHIK